MESFTSYILSAFALMLVIEGLLYALFTDKMKQMMSMALSLPTDKLRQFGLFMTALGLFSLWIISKF